MGQDINRALYKLVDSTITFKEEAHHILKWKETSHYLRKQCANSGFNVSDIYLVGSQVIRHQINSDFDSVIVIEKSESERTLKMLVEFLHQRIND